MDNKQIVEKSLNEFAEMGEMDSFSDMLGEMMARQEEKKSVVEAQHQVRKKMINKEIEKTEKKYGVLITPKQGGSTKVGGKLGTIKEEEL